MATGVPSQNGLSDAHLALVRAIADTIIPRTDTPGASDVGVHRFVEVIVTEQARDDERNTFLAGLDAINARAAFATLSEEARATALGSLEREPRNVQPGQTYWRLKSLIIHGYFTSEPVMKDVLKTTVMPGKFVGAAPVAIKRRPSGTAAPRSDEGHAHG